MEKVNYSTTLILGLNKYQLIYSSQLYGTNFDVYGKFTIDKTIGEDTCKILHAHFKLLNLKGIIDIGIYGKPFLEIKNVKINNKDVKVIHVELKLQAMSSQKAKDSTDIDIDLESKKIKVDKTLPFLLNRKLVPLAGDLCKNPLVNGVFDVEYFKRDGLQYLRRENYDIPIENYENNTNPVYDNPSVKFDSPGQGLCRQSMLNILVI